MKVIFILAVLLLPIAVCEVAFSTVEQDAYLKWRLLQAERTQDGGTDVVYELSLPVPRDNLTSLEIFYTITPQIRLRPFELVQGEKKVYTKTLNGQGKILELPIYVGQASKVELWGRIEFNGQRHVARTILGTFGGSGLEDTQASRLDSQPLWASLNLNQPPAYFFIAQAKQSLPFVLNMPDLDNQAKIQIFDGENSTILKRQFNGTYRYTPPDFPMMETPPYSIFRDLQVVASLPAGDMFSYYLPVYRARFGHFYFVPGLGLLAVSILIPLIWVYLKGRRFKWQ